MKSHKFYKKKRSKIRNKRFRINIHIEVTVKDNYNVKWCQKQSSQLNRAIGIMLKHHPNLLHHSNQQLDHWVGLHSIQPISNRYLAFWNWSNWWVNTIIWSSSNSIMKSMRGMINAFCRLGVSICVRKILLDSSTVTFIDFEVADVYNIKWIDGKINKMLSPNENASSDRDHIAFDWDQSKQNLLIFIPRIQFI